MRLQTVAVNNLSWRTVNVYVSVEKRSENIFFLIKYNSILTISIPNTKIMTFRTD